MGRVIGLLVSLVYCMIQPSHQRSQGEALSRWSGLNKATSKLSSIPVRKDAEYLTESKQAANESRDSDFLRRFPGQPGKASTATSLLFKQYSGYITVNATAGRAHFYYFAQAVNNPENKPLILWLQGGPGCSSFGIGAMSELGPWRVNNKGKGVFYNRYSWNQEANVLFVETPAGVGFSYSNTSSDYVDVGDARTAEDNYAFLVNWFQRFPEFQNRPLYLAGESYAGYYLPELAQTIINHQEKGKGLFMNVKGMLIGNGVINRPTDIYGNYTYAWNHGLISEQTYNNLIANCKNGSEASCRKYQEDLIKERGPIDPFFIYAPTCHEGDPSYHPPRPDFPYLVPGYDPCLRGHVISFLNKKLVQQALHVANIPVPWSLCNISLNAAWKDSPETVLPIFKTLIEKKWKLLIYSGDVDAVVPFIGTIEGLKLLKLDIEKAWSPWISDFEVGGYKIGYTGLTFATVRGAGHEVPRTQPSRALVLLQDFLRN